MTKGKFPQLKDVEIYPLGEIIGVPVPANLQEMKKIDMDLALDWRMKTREIFQYYFQKGYTAIRLVKSDSEYVYYYQLMKLNEER